MGADIVIDEKQIRIAGGRPLKGLLIDASDIPDLVPALAVIATRAQGKTDIVNVHHARIKETDRIHSMTEGLRRMGARIEEHPDGLTVYASDLSGTLVAGYHDHRTVMALTVAGMIAVGTTYITDAESIHKTYPRFIDNMQSIGALVDIHSLALKRHIILIGFKHVGKTSIGQQLATCLNKTFVDLDHEIEKQYKENHGISFSCRQIMQSHGELYFRGLESETLEKIIKKEGAVISLGGGTPLSVTNQSLIKPHLLLHVVAPKGVVFERIMVISFPAFFDPSDDPYTSFSYLWNERDKIYRALTTLTIDNNKILSDAVNAAMIHIYHDIKNSGCAHEY
jgi:shikimate kinase